MRSGGVLVGQVFRGGDSFFSDYYPSNVLTIVFSISGHFLDRCQLLYWMLTVFLGLTASRWWVIFGEAAVWAVGVVCFIWVWAWPIWYFCGVFVGLLPNAWVLGSLWLPLFHLIFVHFQRLKKKNTTQRKKNHT